MFAKYMACRNFCMCFKGAPARQGAAPCRDFENAGSPSWHVAHQRGHGEILAADSDAIGLGDTAGLTSCSVLSA